MARDELAGPTLEEVRQWPATVTVAQASKAFGISRSQGYVLAEAGKFPARLIDTGSRRDSDRSGGRRRTKHRVVTASIVEALSATGPTNA